jgi:CheY-like chemotaxis protein
MASFGSARVDAPDRLVQPTPVSVWSAVPAWEDEVMTTMLIVDDELDMRMLVRIVIEMANNGLSIVGEAADGIEALQVWRDLDGPPVPDVIILDNRMPELSGLEVAEEILQERPGQLIVLYSAFLDDTVRARAAELGIAMCVSKNELEQLPHVVRALTSA